MLFFKICASHLLQLAVAKKCNIIIYGNYKADITFLAGGKKRRKNKQKQKQSAVQ